MTYPPPPPPAPPRPSLWQRFKAWPLIAKIATIGCGGLVALFALLMIIGIIVAIVMPEDAGERAADSQDTPSVEASESESASSSPSESASEESEEPSESPSDEESESESASSSEPASESPSETASEAASEEPATEESSASPSPTPSQTEAEQSSSEPSAERTEIESSEAVGGGGDGSTTTATVVRAVDGDTLELANGERVRVNGIDTPERGECGYEEASNRMAAMTVGQTVTLTQYGDDRDHYDRLIRYVDVAGTDTGLVLIQEGLAIARYDSTDGYGWHPREDQYHSADAGAEDISCAPTPEPEPAPEPTQEQDTGGGGGGNCAPGYSPCVPVYPPDVNCGDLDYPVEVTGSDPHGLDRDGDGFACESN